MRKLILSSVALVALTGAALAGQSSRPGHGPQNNQPDVNARAHGYLYNREVANARQMNATAYVDATVSHTQSGGSSWTVNGAHQFQATANNGVAAANSQGAANQAASSSYEGMMRGAAAGNASITDQGGFAQVGNVAAGNVLTPSTGQAQGSTSGGFSGGGSYTNTNTYTGSVYGSVTYNSASQSNASGYGAGGAISYRN
ncbi:hypothetical protein [Microvirga sp. M2]|uniref:hypothetical protein n=1 Tax=Microvirga sp. M2 TaxID=3073270 RepID=UPI0039C0DB70